MHLKKHQDNKFSSGFASQICVIFMVSIFVDGLLLCGDCCCQDCQCRVINASRNLKNTGASVGLMQAEETTYAKPVVVPSARQEPGMEGPPLVPVYHEDSYPQVS